MDEYVIAKSTLLSNKTRNSTYDKIKINQEFSILKDHLEVNLSCCGNIELKIENQLKTINIDSTISNISICLKLNLK